MFVLFAFIFDVLFVDRCAPFYHHLMTPMYVGDMAFIKQDDFYWSFGKTE